MSLRANDLHYLHFLHLFQGIGQPERNGARRNKTSIRDRNDHIGPPLEWEYPKGPRSLERARSNLGELRKSLPYPGTRICPPLCVASHNADVCTALRSHLLYFGARCQNQVPKVQIMQKCRFLARRFRSSGLKGAIPPEVEHDVEPLDDDTEFYIEFFRGVGE